MKFFGWLVTILLIVQYVGLGQVITGQVMDQKTKEALSYVNIGVVELGIGTVSNKQGAFSLHIPEGTADSVLFSVVGIPLAKWRS